MVKNGKVIVLTFFIFMTGILFITFKISYSLFTYKGNGNKVVNIKSNGITFKYTEGSNTFSLNDAMPMTDEQGMAQDNYFEFSINGIDLRFLKLIIILSIFFFSFNKLKAFSSSCLLSKLYSTTLFLSLIIKKLLIYELS